MTPASNDNKPTQISLGVLDRLATAIASNLILLTLVLLFLFGGIFAYSGIIGETLLLSPSKTIDMGGRIISCIIGGFILFVALRITLQSIGILQGTKPDVIAKELLKISEENASTQISSNIVEAAKKIHATQKQVTVPELYDWLNKQQIIKDIHYEDLATHILKADR